MFTRQFWEATLERMFSTAAQAALLVIGADQFDALQADAKLIGSFALGGAVLCLLKCVAASNLGNNPGPSLVSAEKLA